MISDFSVEDLKTRKLVYTINGKLNVTNDSFVFDVQDDWGNVRMGNRYGSIPISNIISHILFTT